MGMGEDREGDRVKAVNQIILGLFLQVHCIKSDFTVNLEVTYKGQTSF